MDILVTGGAGFVGSQLAVSLEQNGHNVTIVDWQMPDRHAVLHDFRGKTVSADVSEESFWTGLTERFDAVFHEAACTDTTVTDEAFMMRHNRDAFQYVLDWAIERGTNVIYASSAGTYGNSAAPQTVGVGEEPVNIYGHSKLAMDQMVRGLLPEPPIKIIGLRYFNVYGPGENRKKHMASMIYQLAQQMREGKNPRIFFDGTQKRDQVYVKDIVQANLCALAAGHEASGIYNVGTGTAVTFNAIIDALNATLGLSLPPDYIENPYVGSYQNFTQADIAPTQEKLGYDPAFTLLSGVQDYFESGLLLPE